MLLRALLALAPAGWFAPQAENPAFRPNTAFDSHEDLSSPKYAEFLRKYPIEEAVRGETDEFKRILLLRSWLHRRVRVDRSQPERKADDALDTLDEGPKGGNFHCAHLSVALNPVLNAMGHVSRLVFAGAGEKEPERLSGSHGANEVWCNALRKWILVDAEHDTHFEKGGLPLSALEVRDEVLRDGARRMARVKGPERTPLPAVEDESWGQSARTYAWVSFYSEGNRFARWPERIGGFELVLDDDAFRTRTWHRNGKPHWAYAARRFKPVAREALEWTPNVLDVRAERRGDTAELCIFSCTPGLKEYQAKRGDAAWARVDERFTLRLAGAREVLLLRSVNLAGVAGPEHRLTLER
jgi:hypothetical protein